MASLYIHPRNELDGIKFSMIACASVYSCNAHLFGGDRETVFRTWSNSDGEQWKQKGDADEILADYDLDQNHVASGPDERLDLVVLPNWQMKYEYNQPADHSYGFIDVQGVLIIEESATHLRCQRMRIGAYGELRIGTPETPYQSNFELIFTGDHDVPHNIGSDTILLGNKGIANFGLLSLHGTPRVGGTKTRLLSPITTGVEVIIQKTDLPEGWVNGDFIGVGPSGFNYEEYEEF